MYESWRELHLELSFPPPSLWPKLCVKFPLLSFWYLTFFLPHCTILQFYQEGGNVLPWISHTFITQRLFWDVLAMAAAALRLGKYMTLGLMRFTVHVWSISIEQCVEDVLLTCRSADWLHSVQSRASMSQIYWTYCISAVHWNCRHLFNSSGHQVAWVELQLLVLLWAYCYLEITGKCTTICNVNKEK